jgi:hypothetical protein
MAKVKVFEATTEGFRLIRREPKAVLVWGAALFVVLGLPMILYMNRFSAAFLQMSGAQTEQEMLGALGSFFAIIPLLIVGTILGYTLVGGAIIRAVIAPEDRSHFYLRLSKAEFWMALSAVVGAILGYIASFVLLLVIGLIVAIPAVILAAAATSGVDAGPETMSPIHWAFVLAIFAVEIGIGYLLLRFSMAPLMSFDERRFRLFESWRFTQGSGWRLFGLVVVISLAVLVLELIIMAVLFGGFGSWFIAMTGDAAAMQDFMAKTANLYASPWMLLWAVVGALLGGALMSLLIAPFARAYVTLRTGVAAAAPAEDLAVGAA